MEHQVSGMQSKPPSNQTVFMKQITQCRRPLHAPIHRENKRDLSSLISARVLRSTHAKFFEQPSQMPNTSI